MITSEVGSTSGNAHGVGVGVVDLCLRFLAMCHCHNPECVVHAALLIESATFSAVLPKCRGFLMVGMERVGSMVEPIVSWPECATLVDLQFPCNQCTW